MKSKIKKYIKEFMLFAIFIFIASNAISLYRSSDLNTPKLNLETVTLINNKNYTIDKSKPIMIHFWATWCPICKVEASNIQKISENFQVITIAVQSGSDAKIEKYQKENSVNFMVINDEDSSLAKQFNISVFPTTIIYNKNGKAVFSDVGYTSTWVLWLKMLWV